MNNNNKITKRKDFAWSTQKNIIWLPLYLKAQAHVTWAAAQGVVWEWDNPA